MDFSKTDNILRRSKQIISQKQTINLRKTKNLSSSPEALKYSDFKGLFTLTSMQIIGENLSIIVPLQDLGAIIFAPQEEVIYNISQCLKENQWIKTAGLYSYFDEIDEGFECPYYLNSLETSYFAVTPRGVYAKILGSLINALENKGLEMKYCKLIDKSGPEAMMAWEGSAAIAITNKIAETYEPSFTRFMDKNDFQSSLGSNFRLISSIIPEFTAKIGETYYKIIYPSISYTSESTSSLPISLGLLKNLVTSNFADWQEKILKKYENYFSNRKPETSSLKANIIHQDNFCVLTLNSYEISISNDELEASFAFKVNDMEYIFQNSGPDLMQTLMKTASLQEKTIQGKKLWELTIEIEDTPTTKGKIPEKSTVNIGNQNFLCKFTMPWAELYMPHAENTKTYSIPSQDLIKIIENNFENWQTILTKYFS